MYVRRIVIAAAAAAALAIAAPSRAETARSSGAPEVKKQGEPSYVSGGVGEEDQKRLERIAKDFNLKVTFASSSGQYAGGNRLEIRDQSGKTVIDTEARGPLFYADLPPGTYTITSLGSERGAQKKTVRLADRGRSEVLFDVQHAEREPNGTEPRSAQR